MSIKSQLLEKINNHAATVGVVGLGYVGLPLAVEFAQGGLTVVGIDVDVRKIEAINRGESYIPDVPTPLLAGLVQAGRLRASAAYSVLAECDAVSICVPTPLNKTRDPDMSYVIEAANQVAANCHPGLVIVLESTTYPGTTDEILMPRLQAAGFTVGQDVFVAFSPERIDPGNTHYGVRNTPKVLGGATPDCTAVASALYRVAVDSVVPVSSLRTAEMVKLLENTFRAVNIGLVNEMALMCAKLQVDVWEVIEAAATKPYGYMKFTPGPGIGGHCLAGDEFIFVRHSTGQHTLTLRSLVTRLEAEVAPVLTEQAEMRVFAPKGWEVLSYDPETATPNFRPLTYVSERRFHGAMVRVWTCDGRRVHVTEAHPMIVARGGQLCTCAASALQPGDELVAPLGQPEQQPLAAVDLIDHLTVADVGRLRAKAVDEQYAAFDSQLRPHLLALGLSPRDVYRQNVMPLEAYLRLEAEGCMPISRRQLRLVSGRGPSYNEFPAVVEIDEDFARLIGYYLSEGCLTDDGALRARFTFHTEEHELLGDLRAILGRLGVRFSEQRDRQWQAQHVKVSSRPFGLLLRDVLGCGTNCYNMQIPGQWLTAPEPLRRGLLTGLLRGDGDVHHVQTQRVYQKNGRYYRHKINTATVGYFSSSPVLFQQVIRLIQGLGLVPTFKRDQPQLRLYGAEALEQLRPMFLDVKRERLEAYRQGRSKPMATTQSRRYPGFATVPVRSVEPAEPAEAVYSLEVEGTHTFVTSYGLLVHNCIPIDPLYLSWKLKSLNYTARFIELADSINSRMPEHVVALVTDALNDEGRSLNGARILVLGVAYKKDSDDLRESPALDVIAELVARKARVTYHDPRVARLVVEGLEFESQPLTAAALQAADCVVITTDHSDLDWALVRANARVVVDTRNALKGEPSQARIVKL